MNKEVGVDIDGDGKPDLSLDLKNKVQIEEAKKLPPQTSHDLIDQKILFLEEHIKEQNSRLDKIEDKIYRR